MGTQPRSQLLLYDKNNEKKEEKCETQNKTFSHTESRVSSYWSEVVENIPENFDGCCFRPSCAQGPFTGTHWNIYLYPDLCMVSGPYAEWVRSYPPFGAHYFKIMQFVVYTPISDPKMVIFLKIRTPFSKDCVWAWVLWLNICFTRTKGGVGVATMTFWPLPASGARPQHWLHTQENSKRIWHTPKNTRSFHRTQKYQDYNVTKMPIMLSILKCLLTASDISYYDFYIIY